MLLYLEIALVQRIIFVMKIGWFFFFMQINQFLKQKSFSASCVRWIYCNHIFLICWRIFIFLIAIIICYPCKRLSSGNIKELYKQREFFFFVAYLFLQGLWTRHSSDINWGITLLTDGLWWKDRYCLQEEKHVLEVSPVPSLRISFKQWNGRYLPP